MDVLCFELFPAQLIPSMTPQYKPTAHCENSGTVVALLRKCWKSNSLPICGLGILIFAISLMVVPVQTTCTGMELPLLIQPSFPPFHANIVRAATKVYLLLRGEESLMMSHLSGGSHGSTAREELFPSIQCNTDVHSASSILRRNRSGTSHAFGLSRTWAPGISVGLEVAGSHTITVHWIGTSASGSQHISSTTQSRECDGGEGCKGCGGGEGCKLCGGGGNPKHAQPSAGN